MLGHVWLFATPWIAACQASLSFTISWSLIKLMSIVSVMPSNHLILRGPLFLLPSIFPSIRVFSNESALHFRWPKYWSKYYSSYIQQKSLVSDSWIIGDQSSYSEDSCYVASVSRILLCSIALMPWVKLCAIRKFRLPKTTEIWEFPEFTTHHEEITYACL